MSTLIAGAVRSGSFEFSQPVIKRHVEEWLNGDGFHHLRLLGAFDNALVERRTAVVPLDDVFRGRGFGASNDLYIQHAVELATSAAEEALRTAGIAPKDVDYVVSSSCTGFMIPSVDAHVAERLGMKSSLRRLPITEHGCNGGAVALANAHDYLVVHPGHVALVIAVELPSLTFQTGDRAPANVISTALFGDGAAALVLSGERRRDRPRIVRTGSRRFPRSLDWMGFRLEDSGLHVVLSPEISRQVRLNARPVIDEFLAESGLRLADVRHLLFHPGGRRILEALEETLELDEGALAVSRQVLREHGNLSSATVLFIAQEHLARGLGKSGDKGLLLAFGPGFGAELLLLEWN